MEMRKPRAAPVFAHLLQREKLEVSLLCVGTGTLSSPLREPRWRLDRCGFHANFSQCISGYLSLWTLVCAGVKQRACVCARAPGGAQWLSNLGEGSVSPSRCVFAPPRNGNAQLFSGCLCDAVKSALLRTCFPTHLLFFQESAICSLTAPSFPSVLIFAAPLFFLFFSVKCSLDASKKFGS